MIAPYKIRPHAPHMSILLAHDEAVCECGLHFHPSQVPKESKVWCSHELASRLLAAGKGEALAWNGTRIRWRAKSSNDDFWPVSVMQIPFPDDPDDQLEGLVRWRDWLVGYGASCQASLGSASWSLLRASLEETLWTGVGSVPPIQFTMGGRIELGPMGPGEWWGVEHWDFQAAYAYTLGRLEYGGRWLRDETRLDRTMAIRHLERGGTGFVRAKILIPRMLSGPLVERPKTYQGSLSSLLPTNYPHGVALTGIWTWQEIEAALAAGCKILKVLDVYLHLVPEGNRFPFRQWWERVLEGRSLGGFAGLLAKATGNALWGQFALVPKGHRQIMSYYRASDGRAQRYVRNVPRRGQRPGAPDLTETITGRVRAQAFRFMLGTGQRLLSVHTDGGWVLAGESWLPPRGMRMKQEAERIQVLGAQCLRYWPVDKFGDPPKDPVTIVAGWPPQLADETFDQLWEENHVGSTLGQ